MELALRAVVNIATKPDEVARVLDERGCARCDPRTRGIVRLMRSGYVSALSFAVLGGCYSSYELGDDALDPGGAAVWSEITTVFAPTMSRPQLQGSEHELVALDSGFLVLWVFNDGQLGIAAARFDDAARVVSGPSVIVAAEPPLERSPELIAAMRLGSGVAVYYLADDGRIRLVHTDDDGVRVDLPRVIRDDASTHYRLDVTVGAGRSYLSYMRADERVLVPLDAMGEPSADPYLFYATPGETWPVAVGDDGERAHLTWAETMASGDDRLFHATVRWDGSEASEPREIHRAETAIVGAPFLAQGEMWAERSDFRESVLMRLADPTDVIAVTTSPNRGSLWATLADGTSAVTEEADEPYTLSTRLVFRRFSFIEARARETRPVVDSSCDIEEFSVAGTRALGVSWVESCGERVLRVRVRRPR